VSLMPHTKDQIQLESTIRLKKVAELAVVRKLEGEESQEEAGIMMRNGSCSSRDPFLELPDPIKELT